jgi:hypothetical protein
MMQDRIVLLLLDGQGLLQQYGTHAAAACVMLCALALLVPLALLLLMCQLLL